MRCPNCGNDNRDGAKFCDECGSPIGSLNAEHAAGQAESADSAADAGSAGETGDGAEGANEVCRADGEGGSDDEQMPEAEERKPEDVEKTPESEELISGEPEGDEADDAEGRERVVDKGGNECDPDAGKPQCELQNLSIDDTQAMQVEGGFAGATQAIGADLAGFDQHVDEFGERLVDPGYRIPEDGYRDGSTMQMPRIQEGEPQKAKDYLASSTAEKAPRKPMGGKVKIAVGVVLALAAIAAIVTFATYQMQVWGGKVVPDVTGMTEADARSVLSDSGFSTQTEQVKSDDTEGLVLIMDPAAGSRVDEGSEVVIHIATTRTIPEVVGKSADEAKKLLAEAGYENVKVSEQHSDKKKGTVLSVNPKAGQRAKSTAEVSLKVAKPYTVPSLAGKSVDEAITQLEKEGFGYEVVYYDSSEYAEGTVIETEPAAGTEVTEGYYIVLNVAQARGNKLEQAVLGYLAPGATVTIGGTSYIIDSVDSVSYQGDNTVAYTATARPFIVFFGQTVEAAPQEVDGIVTFTEDDEIASVS